MDFGLDAAKKFLNVCKREDVINGLGEVTSSWFLDGEKVAGGHFGKDKANIWIDMGLTVVFHSSKAFELWHCNKP